jgi:hypothetical protein
MKRYPSEPSMWMLRYPFRLLWLLPSILWLAAKWILCGGTIKQFLVQFLEDPDEQYRG